ncbi:MAG: repeat-containing protein [Pedosphaera sp.]|nr:repeat-containing protein [Pedosphaera sp.]
MSFCHNAAMRKRFRIAVAILCVAILAGIAWVFVPPTQPAGPEPVYKGRPVSVWVSEIWMANEEENPQFKEVVAIGEPAVPYLIKRLKDPRPFYARNQIYMKLWQSTPMWLRKRMSDPRLSGPKQERAQISSALVEVLGRIGPPAKAAVPELIRIVKDKDVPGWTRATAISALRRIGPAAKPAVPALLARLKDDHLRGRRQYFDLYGPNYDSTADNWDLIQRGEAALTVACLDPSNSQAIKLIWPLLDATNASTRAYGAVALWRLQPDPGIQRIVEDHLRDSDWSLRFNTVLGLKQIGKPAESFVPLLTKVRDETNPTNMLWSVLDNAIKAVHSTVADGAAVK